MLVLRYNMRSLLARLPTTLATAAGVGLVVFVVASTLMLSAGVTQNAAAYGREDAAIVLRRSADNEFGSSMFEHEAQVVRAVPGLAQRSGVPLVASEVVVSATLERPDHRRGNVQLRGISEASLKARDSVTIVAGRMPRIAAGEVLVGKSVRGRFQGLELGDTLSLRKGPSLKVVGVFTAGPAYDSEVWLDIETVRAVFGRQGRISSMYVRLDPSRSFTSFRRAIEHDKRLGLRVILERDYFLRQTEGMASFVAAMGTLLSVFFGLGAMIGAMITMYSSVATRQREIGTLRALGFSKTSIIGAFLAESMFIALLGGFAGALLAVPLKFANVAIMQIGSFTEAALHFEPTAEVLITAMIAAGAMGVIGGLLPALRAGLISPASAMRA